MGGLFVGTTGANLFDFLQESAPFQKGTVAENSLFAVLIRQAVPRGNSAGFFKCCLGDMACYPMSMDQRAMKRIDFAALAGVHRGTVTKDCRTRLSAAVIGKRIDAAHPCAIAYVQEKRAARTAAADNNGLDPIYYGAVAWCHQAQRYSSRGLRDNFKIGAVRATAIIQLMRAAGEIPAILPTPASPQTPAPPVAFTPTPPVAPATAPPAVVPATTLLAAAIPLSTDGVSASPHATVDSRSTAGAVPVEDVWLRL